MMEKWLFFAISLAAVLAIVTYDRGRVRILRRRGEREVVRIYRALRRGLQRDWKPDPRVNPALPGLRGEFVERHPVEIVYEAELGHAHEFMLLERAPRTPRVEDIKHPPRQSRGKTPGTDQDREVVDSKRDRREQTQVVGFIAGAVLGTVAARRASGWSSWHQRMGARPSGRR